MKICLVTAFPPSTGGLSEYGFHVAQECSASFSQPYRSGGRISPDHVEPTDSVFCDAGRSMIRAVIRLLKTLHRLKPDVVCSICCQHFRRNPLVAFSGS